MRHRATFTVQMLMIAAIVALPMRAQQKPFTQEQVVSMVRDGFGDESGAKLIEQRGIDFAPSEGFYQTLKAAGASQAFLNPLRAARRNVTYKQNYERGLQAVNIIIDETHSHAVLTVRSTR